MSTSLILQVRTDTADAEELGELTADLRQALLDASVSDCTIAAPQRSGLGGISMERAADPAMLNILLISLASTNGLRAIVKAIEVWMASQRCTIHIRMPGGRELDYSGPQNAELFTQLQSALEAKDNSAIPSSPPAQTPLRDRRSRPSGPGSMTPGVHDREERNIWPEAVPIAQAWPPEIACSARAMLALSCNDMSPDTRQAGALTTSQLAAPRQALRRPGSSWNSGRTVSKYHTPESCAPRGPDRQPQARQSRRDDYPGG